MHEELISRGEIVALLSAVSDTAVNVEEIRRMLEEDDGEEDE